MFHPETHPIKQPIRVTLLYILVLSLTAWNGLRLWAAIHWWSTLSEFASTPWTLYLACSGAFWLSAGLFLAWSLWQKKAWARVSLGVAATGYTVWYWSERLWLHSAGVGWPVRFVLNIIVITYVFAILLDPRNSKYFQREAYERAS